MRVAVSQQPHAGAYVRRREGPFWQTGRAHRVKSIELLRTGGLEDTTYMIVSQAITACGETIGMPLIENEPDGVPCKKCFP